MTREKELLELIGEDNIPLLGETVDQIIFLEAKLDELKRLPFIQVDRKNPMRQRNTPAAKMYKEFLQQYINCIKLVESVLYRDKRLEGEEVEDSPLRAWYKSQMR